MPLILPLLLLLHLLLLVSTRFTLWPEMIVYPYLVNNGFLLYKDIVNPYMPSFIYFLALLEKLVGPEPVYFQIFTWIIILTVDVLIFILAKNLTGKTRDAVLSTFFFAIVSIPFSVNNLWFDLSQTLPVILSVYFFHKFLKNPNDKNALLASSLFVTVAFLIKQQAAWLVIYFILVLIFRFGKKSQALILSQSKIFAAPAVFFLLHALFFAKIGTFAPFLFWTIYFPLFESASRPGYLLLPTIKQLLPLAALFLIFTPLFISRKNDLKFFAVTAIPLLLFAYPRFDYFHLIPALAVLSLAVGANFNKIYFNQKTSASVSAISVISILILSFFTARYLSRNWTSEVRFFEKGIYQTADLIRTVTSESETIYIQNGPDQILPLAGRLPTKPWADEFPWYLEVSETQDKVLDGIKSANPRVIIFKPYEQGPEFEIGAYRPQKIAGFLDANYQNSLQISDYWLKTRK